MQAGLKYRHVWIMLGWLLVASVWYLSLTPRPPKFDLGIDFFDKISHFTAYAVIMGWFMQIYFSSGTRLSYATGFICMGILIEFIQGMGPDRMFEYADMLANAAGVLFALLVLTSRYQYALFWFEKKLAKVK